ncbi:hypothetical protein AVEN_100586-1 [Araneus ventricosus]|uniref:CCHC-type domain-containing protein n=1 Tax=Araneus ventricosus TaxID=182803 RepID=A0A4Y2Q1Y2_ARAVE|nr:hypothetical protein AVEN_100586-1 [Araneus ventricosus]
MVGGAVGARILISYRMGSSVKQTDLNTSLKSNELPRRLPKFLVLHNEEDKLRNMSPFLIQKHIYTFAGNVQSVKKMKSGDLLVESSSLRQSEQLLSITKFGDIPITVSAHASLNYTRGVMSSDEFLMVSDSEFVSELEAQKVIAARRITLKRDGQIIPTRHVILTFDTPVLPKKITAGYISCDIRPYLPNPVHCFKCQRFGYTKTACRGSSALCPRCSEPGHEETICQNPEKCFNCKGNHASYSKTCPKWKLEKEIQSVKVTRNISIQEARKIVHDQTPKTNHSYTAALKTIKNPDTPLEPIQTPTDAIVPKPSTSAAKNEETITVKLSVWLALLKAHKLSLEKEKTNDKKQEFLKPAPKNKRPKKHHTNSTGKNSNVKIKSNPNKTKSQNKESESDLQTSDNSISEMELSEEVNLASFKSPTIIDSNFKSKFLKKPK